MDIRKALFEMYWKFEKVITPGLKYSQYLYEDTLKGVVGNSMEWLDLGCGHHILPLWRSREEADLVACCRRIVGIDADLASLQKHRSIQLLVAGDIAHLPFAAGCFDLVTANMVVEHLESPDSQFQEIARVLRPGGILVIHTPNRLGYSTLAAKLIPEGLKKTLVYWLQKRSGDDVFPTFYRANTNAELSRVAQNAGFTVNRIRQIVSSAELVVFPPFVLFELMWIRVLMTDRMKRYRTNLIGIFQKRRRA